MKLIFLSAILLVFAGYSTAASPARTENQPLNPSHTDLSQISLQAIDAEIANAQSPHIHLSMIAYPDPILTKGDIDKFVNGLSSDNFLKAGARKIDNPLSPCSLLAAGMISSELNRFWAGIIKETLSPPRGTNILGMFDNDLRSGKIPREHPTKTAEIIARLYIWYSWGVNAQANTVIQQLNQQQCLELVTSSPDSINAYYKKELSKPEQTIYLHYPAVEHYSATFSGQDAEAFFMIYRDMGFLTLSSGATNNPLAPCSLLKGMRLGSALNELWASILMKRVQIPSRKDPLLGVISQNLKGGKVSMDDPNKAAQTIALLFASRIVAANALTEFLISESTQNECLDEIFSPGIMRLRLMK